MFLSVYIYIYIYIYVHTHCTRIFIDKGVLKSPQHNQKIKELRKKTMKYTCSSIYIYSAAVIFLGWTWLIVNQQWKRMTRGHCWYCVIQYGSTVSVFFTTIHLSAHIVFWWSHRNNEHDDGQGLYQNNSSAWKTKSTWVRNFITLFVYIISCIQWFYPFYYCLIWVTVESTIQL